MSDLNLRDFMQFKYIFSTGFEQFEEKRNKNRELDSMQNLIERFLFGYHYNDDQNHDHDDDD